MRELSKLSGHKKISEPSLIFANKERDIHPLRGLCEHGPFSKSLDYLQDIQLATISPFKNSFKLINLIGELNKPASPIIAPDYYPDYPGFESLFDAKLLTPKLNLKIELPQEANQFAQAGDYKAITKYLLHAISQLVSHKTTLSVVFIYLPSSWEKCFTDENFDLHDHIKAKAAPLGIPIQIINDNSIQTKSRANVMWGLSVATYSKAGGVPWKVEALNENHAYIGLSYAMKTSKKDDTEYTTCCSQVYDPEGTGFEFIAFDTHEYTQDRKRNPYLSYNEMHAVMSQSLKIYQDNHGGSIPNKITVHKTTPFTDQEIEGCYDAFGHNTEIELLQIIRHTKINGVRFDNKKTANYPCKRGSYFPISKNECLLWIQGTLEGITESGKELFKEGGLKPMPKPVLLRRFSGNGGWHETCSSIIGLSKMDWNNNTIYKSMPVTIVYSKLFASVVKNVPDINNKIYDYRFFM